MGADKLVQNTPNAPKIIYLPKLFAQALNFGISIEKASLGIRSPCFLAPKAFKNTDTNCQNLRKTSLPNKHE